MKNQKEERFSRGPIFGTMIAMGVPTFVASMVNLLYNIVDRIFIGHIENYGAEALTGVGVTFPVIMVVTAFSNLVGAGGAPIAGIALGRGNRARSEQILGNGFAMLLTISVILTVVFQIIKKPFLYMFGASETTYAYGEKYLTIYLCGTIFVMFSAGLNTFITMQGAAVTAMFSVLIGAVMNLILDPVLIFGCRLGVRGAALATVLSQASSAAWVLSYLISKKAAVRLKKNKVKLEKEIVKQIASLGVSPFIMAVTESLITVVLNSGAQKYGNDLYVGSITILQSVVQMICTPMNGFANGVQSVISYNYGAGNRERVKKFCAALIGLSVVMTLSIASVCMMLPANIAGLFTENEELISLCAGFMPIFIGGMGAFGLQCGSQSCFMALGRVKESFFFAILRKVILLTPLAILLPAVMNSVSGIYWAEPISDTVSGVLCGTVFLLTIRKVLGRSERKPG